jgi:hypothetical protein
MPLTATRHPRQEQAGRLILAVQNHAGYGNEQREQSDGYPTEPMESLAEPLAEIFAGVGRAHRKTIGVRHVVYGRGWRVAAGRGRGCRNRQLP